MKNPNLISGSEIRQEIFELIQKDHPSFTKKSYITIQELNIYRRRYLAEFIQNQRNGLSSQEKEVLDAFQNKKLIPRYTDQKFDENLTVGEKLADRIAEFGGSWTFIISFFTFILIWMIVNIWVLSTKPFDPYPFILLNLFLSCLAAIQAPIIMMSQNRQEAKDRFRSEQDYKVNLSAELEVRLLNLKVDQLLIQHHQKLVDFQEIQVEYLEDILKLIKK